jgi:hypothetical protein
MFLTGQNSASRDKTKKKPKECKDVPIEEVFGKKITIQEVDTENHSGYEYLTIHATLDNTDIKFETSSTVLSKQLEKVKHHLPALGIINKIQIDGDRKYYDFTCIKRKAWAYNTTLKNFVKQEEVI